MTVVLVALIAAVVGPSVLYFLNRAERRENWRRQDAVATRVAAAADALVVSNEERRGDADQVNGKLDQIHTLVNSTLTAAKEATLAALLQTLELQRAEAERVPSDALNEAVAETESKVAELRAEVGERLAQTDVADARLNPSG